MRSEDLVTMWLNNADNNNPAGNLFISGEYAEADIVCETWGGSGRCGTACSYSRTLQCC
jgi:Family of unknown function (DUF6229)